MIGKLTKKQALDNWRLLCENIQSITTVDYGESLQDKQDRIAKARKDYAYFVEYYFPHYCTNGTTGEVTKSAKFHIDAANKVKNTKNLKAVFMWARGHAKSTHCDIFIPLWLKCQEPRELNVMVVVGKSQDNAEVLLGDIQAELENNQRYINDFGLQKTDGNWQDGHFITKDGCAFFARGRGQSPRGLRHRNKRPDYIVIDDLDDDELVNNIDRVNKLEDWVKEALFGALDGGRGRFIMVGNLIGKNSVLARIAKTKGVHVTQVSAIDTEGNPSWKEKYTIDELQSMQDFMGYRRFQKEMMNNPIISGSVFKHTWIKWKKPLKLSNYEELVCYCDPSFKATNKNDFKAVKLWGKTKTGELHHLEAFVRQTTVAEMVRWWYDLHEKITKAGAVCSHYIEANFLQDTILDEFTREGNIRGYQLPIRADKRKKPDKFQRIESISPLWERGFVYYNENKKKDTDMQAGIEQTLAFEKGMSGHDDAPDADEGALYILQKHTRTQTYAPEIGRRTNNKNNW